MHEPPWTTVDQRQCRGDQRMIGSTQPDLLGQRQTEDGARLGVVGQRQPRRTIDQCIDVGQPPQRFADDCSRQCPIGWRQIARVLGGIVHRLPFAQNGIEHLQRRKACRDTVRQGMGRLRQANRLRVAAGG
jgi:hypothetical protein